MSLYKPLGERKNERGRDRERKERKKEDRRVEFISKESKHKITLNVINKL